ncbi:hypothetical protein MNBD_GAMMA04-1513, partial [hydrothermal vent metagenome]
EALNLVDLNRHVNSYKQSIESGRGVIVVAHSQGNFFTNKAYQLLTPWMRSYFQIIGVASPAASVAGGGPRISFDNDMVARLSLSFDTIENPNRTFIDIAWTTFHGFAYYMGEALSGSNPPIATNVARVLIENAILNGVNTHQSAESQWKKVNDVGCLCSEKRITIAHKFDSNLDSNMAGQAVYEFDDDGKVYPVSGDYVFAQLGGSVLESGGVGDVCYVLKDESSVVLGEISGGNAISNLPSGIFTAQLSWEQPDVRLSMSNSLMSNSATGCGVTALGSGGKTLRSVYPGTYPISVAATDYEALSDETFSDLIKLNVNISTRDGSISNQSEFLVTNASQYPSLGSGGKVADILITRPAPNRPPKVAFIPRLPTVDDAGGYGYSRPYGCGSNGCGAGAGVWYGGYYGGGGVSGLSTVISMPVTYEKPKLCQPKKSCGCLPCEFSILSYLNQAKLGPISGGRIILYKATEAHKVDKEILFEGLTTVSNEIDKAGIILLPVPRPGDLPQTTEEVRLMQGILNYEGDFVLELSGGVDIDRDDNLVVDDQFTPVNGKLRLILSKESLLNNDFKINILTEVAYQLSKDLLGENYDKARVQSRLDDIAKRILIDKLYPDAEQPLGRNDLFYWVPAAHKNWLLKDYDSWLEPMVDKVYLGQDLYTDAYEYVYGKAVSETVPLLQSQWFPVSEDVASGTAIGNIKLIHMGGSEITHYVLLNDENEPSTRFSIDALGVVTLNEGVTLDYETDKIYQLQLMAVNTLGESKPVTLVILVTNVLDSIEDTGFSGGLIPENASAGDVIGRITFNDAGEPIERVEVGGADATWFSVDTDGSIRLTELAELDYESKNTAAITVQAFNALGSSRVIPLSFEISDTADDAPLVKHLSVSLSEDAVAGDEVGQVIIESNAPLQSVSLTGSGAEAFTIDLNGFIRVSDVAQLDYESRINYVLSVVAEDTLGEVRRGTVLIKIDNEIDVPKLTRTVLRVLENSAVDTVVGSVLVDNAGLSPIAQFTLSGEGSEHFAIDALGEITLLSEGLSRSDNLFFDLMATATNANGDSLPVFVVVYLDTQRPILGVLRSYSYENAPAGTPVGQVPLASTGADITALRIEGAGSENFNIDLNRNVTVADGASFDFETLTEYVLTVIATNRFGESDPVPLYIQVGDVADTIRIEGAAFSIHEDTLPLSVVGQINVLSLGGQTLSQFVLSGVGSEYFRVDESGTIRTTEMANFNQNIASSYQLLVVAQDSQGSQSNKVALNISVINPLTDVTPPEIHFDARWTKVFEIFMVDYDGESSSIAMWKDLPTEVNVTDNVDSLADDFSVTVTKNGEPYVDAGANESLPQDLVDIGKPSVYVFTYTAIDSSGNQAQAVRTVKVLDVTPPVIWLAHKPPWLGHDWLTTDGYAKVPHYRLIQREVFIDEVSVRDNSAEDIVINQRIYFTPLNQPETLVNAVNTDLIGSYRIEYSAVDSSGNQAQQAVRYVMVAELSIEPFNLNDTGILFSGNFPEGNNLDCVGDEVAGQDCATGLDTFVGFQFTKLDANGVPLEDQSLSYDEQPWQCVLDKHSNLMWEVKDDSAQFTSLHSVNDTFTWYDAKEAVLLKEVRTLGGLGLRLRAGDYHSGDEAWKEELNNSCTGYDSSDVSSYCNTEAFLARVNASNDGKGLCGFSDWRLPSLNELLSIVDYGQSQTVISPDYFPNTWGLKSLDSHHFWSSERYFRQTSRALEFKSLDFKTGVYNRFGKNTVKSKLVRDTK